MYSQMKESRRKSTARRLLGKRQHVSCDSAFWNSGEPGCEYLILASTNEGSKASAALKCKDHFPDELLEICIVVSSGSYLESVNNLLESTSRNMSCKMHIRAFTLRSTLSGPLHVRASPRQRWS